MVTIIERPNRYCHSKNDIRYVLQVDNPDEPGTSVDINIMTAPVRTPENGQSLITVTVYPDKDGNIYFHIRDYLTSQVRPQLPNPNAPIVAPSDNQTIWFWINYRQTTTADPFEDYTADNTNIKLLIYGGIEEKYHRRNNFFQNYLPSERPFLTWLPRERRTFPDQKQFLSYFHATQESSFKVVVNAQYVDLSTTSLTINHTTNGSKIFTILAGITQLGLSTTKKIWHYEIKVVNAANTILAAPIRFIVIYNKLYEYKDLHYFTSLGGIDTIRIEGELDSSVEVTADDVELINMNADHTSVMPVDRFKKTNQKKRDVFRGDVGYLKSPEEQSALVEILISPGIYEIIGDRFVGVLNLKKTQDLRNKEQKKWSFPIEFSYAFEDQVYTPNLSIGAGQIDDTPPICIAPLVGIASAPNGEVGVPYNFSYPITAGTTPITLSGTKAPAGLSFSLNPDQTAVLLTGTPTTADIDQPLQFTLSNCSETTYTRESEITINAQAPPVNPAIFVGNTRYLESDNTYTLEECHITTPPSVVLTIKVTTYIRNVQGMVRVDTNGGYFEVFINSTFTINATPSGDATFNARIDGNPDQVGAISATFTIVATNAGAIEPPPYNTYTISKVF